MPAAIARRPPPLTPEWIPFEIAFEHTHLWRWVILSLLLHVFAILLFGAPSGGSREGRAMWGSLQVMLQRRVEPPAPAQPKPPEAQPEAPKGPAAREAEAPSPMIDSFPPLLDRLPVPEPLPEIAPPLVVPPPTEVQVVPVPPPPPKPAAAPEPPPPEPPAPAPPIPAPLLQPIQPAIEAPRLPAIERAPEIRVPAEAPPIPAQLLQPLPQVQERSQLPPIERAPTIAVPAAPAVPAMPEVVRPTPSPEVSQPAAKVPEPARPEVSRPEAARPEPARPAAPKPETARPEAARPEAPPARGPATQPAPTESPFRRRDEPAGTYDPTKPSLDPDAFRKRAGELTREGLGQRALLPFPLPPVDKPKTKLETAIENARKPDCRDAYKGLGLAAVVPLIANEFGEGTCRW